MTTTTLAVVGGTLIDGQGGTPLADAVVLAERGRITAAGRRAEVPVPAGATVIDAQGQYLLPGFMSGNVHLLDGIMMMGKGGAEYLARFEGRLHEVIEEAAQIALRGGCTTVFDTWNALVPVLNARDRINAGRAQGARIFAAGNIIGMGGPFSADFSMQSRAVISSTFADRMDALFDAGVGRWLSTLPPEEVRPIIRDYLARGVDMLKVAVSDHLLGLLGWKSPYLTFSERVLRVIVEETRRAGVPLLTHTLSVESLNLAVEHAADVMIHATITSQHPIPEELMKRIAAGPGWCEIQPTTHDYQCHLDDTNHPWSGYAGGAHEQNTVRMIASGVKIILGTDAGCTDPDILHELPEAELVDRPWTLGDDHVVWMKAMVEKGMTPMNAILACTANVAKAYHQDADYGTLVPGKVADLVVVRADPLADVTNVRKLSAVVKDGVPVDFGKLPLNPMVTKYPRVEDAQRR
ncbi:MAG: amidohydrolase family protein [Gammaproteobacteria bacterium]|nr:amidohydrolase family protein [Gammaproteobacteria bacterium]MBI5615997.1 amidohydrolase family protein [Gammaproteobacteria bacterium]